MLLKRIHTHRLRLISCTKVCRLSVFCLAACGECELWHLPPMCWKPMIGGGDDRLKLLPTLHGPGFTRTVLGIWCLKHNIYSVHDINYLLANYLRLRIFIWARHMCVSSEESHIKCSSNVQVNHFFVGNGHQRPTYYCSSCIYVSYNHQEKLESTQRSIMEKKTRIFPQLWWWCQSWFQRYA